MTEHSTLSGGELHEPKGVASATAGQSFLCDGAGSGSWTIPGALVSAQVGSSDSSIEWTGLGSSKDLILILNEISLSASQYMQLSFDNGSGYVSSTNYYMFNFYSYSTAASYHYDNDGFYLYDSAATTYTGVYRISNFCRDLPTMITGCGFEVNPHTLVGQTASAEGYVSMKITASGGATITGDTQLYLAG